MSTIMEIYSRVLDCQPIEHFSDMGSPTHGLGLDSCAGSFSCSWKHCTDYMMYNARRKMVDRKPLWERKERKRAAWNWFLKTVDTVSLKQVLTSQVSLSTSWFFSSIEVCLINQS